MSYRAAETGIAIVNCVSIAYRSGHKVITHNRGIGPSHYNVVLPLVV